MCDLDNYFGTKRCISDRSNLYGLFSPFDYTILLHAWWSYCLLLRCQATQSGSAATISCVTVNAWSDPENGHHNWFVWHGNTVSLLTDYIFDNDADDCTLVDDYVSMTTMTLDTLAARFSIQEAAKRLPPNLAQTRSYEIGYYNDRVAQKYNRHLGSVLPRKQQYPNKTQLLVTHLHFDSVVLFLPI